MRKLIAWAFMYSLDGLLADDGTEYWEFCFGLPVDPAEQEQKIAVFQSAYAHLMGRVTYEAMAGAVGGSPPPCRRRLSRWWTSSTRRCACTDGLARPFRPSRPCRRLGSLR